MFGNSVTKHASRCCGVNRYLSKWHKVDGKLVENICPSCGQRDETTFHITRCGGEVFHASVDEIVDWMERNETDPLIALMFERYLRARGDKTLADVASDDLPLDHKVYVE